MEFVSNKIYLKLFCIYEKFLLEISCAQNLVCGEYELQTYSLFFNKLKILKLRNEVSEPRYAKLEPSLL